MEVVLRVNPEDWAWAEAEKIEKHLLHWPHPMRSMQSTGPLKAWCCDFHMRVEYSIGTEPPWCNGGMGVIDG